MKWGFARSVANQVFFMDGGEMVEATGAVKIFDRPEQDRA